MSHTNNKTQHITSEEWKELRTLDNYHAILAIVWDFAIIAIAIACSEMFDNCLIYFVCLVSIGTRIRALAVLLHQASHRVLAKNDKLNYVLGTVFSGWAVFQSFSVYIDSHVSKHHAHLGNPQKDVDYIALIDSKIYGEHRSSEALIWYLFRCFFDAKQYITYLMYLFKHRIWNSKEEPKERMFRLLYWGTILAVLYHYNLCSHFFWYWIMPHLTSANWIGSFIELTEHYPLLEIYPKEPLYMSRNRILGPIAQFFFGAHDEHYHLLHHLYPKVPFWNIKKVHSLLIKRDSKYAVLQHKKGFYYLLVELYQQASYPPFVQSKTSKGGRTDLLQEQ